jgi:phosphate transport system substrate-binding protein
VKLHQHRSIVRSAAVGAGALAVAASLAACGSDNTATKTSTGGTTGSASSSPSGSASSANIACGSGTLTGQGSSAQNTALTQFVKDYQLACGSGSTINYTPNGSGPGVTAFTGKQADWAGSDYPLSSAQQPAADARCGAGNKAISVGTVPGAIAVMYNVPGADTLNLSAATLGKIFDGKITNWSDPAITTDNGGKALAGLPIQAFHRGDGSGTSFNFSNYLNSVAPDAFPHAANKQWPGGGGQGVTGSKAVATSVSTTSGGIGYAEVSFANAAKLKTAAIGNKAGKFVPLTIPNAAEFISKAKVDSSNGNLTFSFDYSVSEDNAYPAVLVTYEIACATGNDSAKLPELKGFLGYLASSAAQSQLTGLGYVALSSDQATQVAAAFNGLS